MTPHLPSRGQHPVLLAQALAALVACGAARADEPNPWYIGATQRFSYESNLYRLGSSPSGPQQTLPAGTSKSDLISTTALVGGLDQAFGRQRAYGSINAGQSVYRDNSKLNTPTYALNLALDWSTIERFSGKLSFGADQSQARYDTVNTGGEVETRKNVSNSRNLEAVGRMGVVTKLNVEAKLGYSEIRYSAADYQRNNYQQQVASLGLNYRPSGLLTMGSALRQTRSEYPNGLLVGGQPGVYRFTRNDLDLTATWQPSQVSSMSGRISSTRTHYEQDSLLDYTAPTGHLAWDWQPTGKLKIRTELRRDFGQNGSVIVGTGVVDYSRTTTTLHLNADQEISAKIAITAAIDQAHRTLTNSYLVTQGTLATQSGSDSTLTFTLSARWTPTRNTQVGCKLSSEQRRTDSTLSTRLSAASMGCFGQITLQ